MYNVGICDDGKNICTALEEMILRYSRESHIPVDIEVWYSGESLCQFLDQQENQIDILFLDIELFEMSGIGVGEFIRNKLEDREMQIIYISGKASYARQLFKTQPMEFLVKPISYEQIKDVMELAVKIIGKSAKKFQYKNGKEYYYVPYADIMYFVSEGRKIKIVTANSEKEFYGKMKDIAKEVPEDFLMIHQSYLVNKEYITKYTYETVELLNGSILTISKVNRKYIRERILQEG